MTRRTRAQAEADVVKAAMRWSALYMGVGYTSEKALRSRLALRRACARLAALAAGKKRKGKEK